MDDRLIYVKTAAGEQAIRERTRLVQRNLRMVLILVEGHATVADLKVKVADGAIVESALVELEQMGLIETLSSRDERERVATAATAAASDGGVPLPAAVDPAATGAAEPMADYPTDVDLEAETEPPISTGAPNGAGEVGSGEVVDSFDVSEPQLRSVITARAVLGDPERQEPSTTRGKGGKGLLRLNSLPETFSRLRETRAPKEPEIDEREFEKAYTEEGPAPVRIEPVKPVKLKPIRRRSPSALGWPARLGIAVLALLTAAASAVLFWPYDRYLPAVEAALAKSLQDPVKIGSIDFVLSPYPSLRLQRISIGGAKPYAEIAEARLVPDLIGLFADKPTLRELELNGVNVRVAAIDRVTGWYSGGDPAVLLSRARVADFTLDLGRAQVGGLAGDAQFGPAGSLARLVLENADKTVSVEATPAAGGFHLVIAATALPLPFPAGMLVTSVDASGDLGRRQLRLGKIEARLYEGLAQGSGSIEWAEGASLAGDFEIKHANLGKLFAALDPELQWDGEVDAKAHVDGRAADLAGLAPNLQVTGSFSAARVTLNRFDLVEAVRSQGRQAVRSGSTNADRMSGTLNCDGRSCRVAKLKLASGRLVAGGELDIARPDGKMQGLMQVELIGSLNVLHAPVAVGGTLARPELLRR